MKKSQLVKIVMKLIDLLSFYAELKGDGVLSIASYNTVRRWVKAEIDSWIEYYD